MPWTKEQKKEYNKQYSKKNREKLNEYREKNKEKIRLQQKEYKEQNKDKGKKYEWKKRGLIDSDNDNYNRIYNLWLNQKYCNACDIELTRTSKTTNTQSCMDHDHETGLFRHIICHKCNRKDNWKNYFC